MMEIFVVGTFWFWVLLLVELVVLTLFIEYESGVGATVALVVFAACLEFFGNVEIVDYVIANPLMTLGIVGAYFLAGTIWGVVKWWIYCTDRKEQYDDLRADYMKSEHPNINYSYGSTIPEQVRKEWQKYYGNISYRSLDLAKVPLASDHKADILRWMTFWVVSMIWTFINDFVKRVFKALYNRISAFLQRISDKVFDKAGVKEDFS